MSDPNTPAGEWRLEQVTSPALPRPTPVLVARNIPYRPGANRLQTLHLYVPHTPDTAALAGTPVTALPRAEGALPDVQVHVHGGAWRDPFLDARSIEAAVAHAFAGQDAPPALSAVASLDYTLTQFPNHPGAPYDAAADGHTDPAREAVHPQHVHDVFTALAFLRPLGLADGHFVLTGHSAGACLAMQAAFGTPELFGIPGLPAPPVPAAVVGLNGLYDLPGLVLGLGPSHEGNSHDYRVMLNNAYGPDDRVWAAASPARLDPVGIAARLRAGRAPRLALLDQSPHDQLVPLSQRERLEDNLRRVDGLRVLVGHRCTGRHAEPWQSGTALWDSVRDVLDAL